MKVLVTGSAGFIGSNLSGRLLAQGHQVIGIDDLNDYYDVSLKKARLARLTSQSEFLDVRADISDNKTIMEVFAEHKPTHVVNLAAQAGVRHSLKDPWCYTQSNINGFLSILEAARAHPVEHLVFASSSSVYGANKNMPFSTHNSAEHPVSLYAATKKANEMMAHNYAHLFGIPSSGLRFFTVYGPWGRPDMALFLFAKAIVEQRPIDVFNYGKMQRDFTYVDDIVGGILSLLQKPPRTDETWNPQNPDPSTSGVAPYRILNIGNSKSEQLMRYIEVLEEKLGRTTQKNMLPLQEGDVPATWADVSDLTSLTGYKPNTPIEVGISNFVDWYVDFYDIKL